VIRLFRPSFGDEEAAAVRDTLASGWVGLGPRTAEFERRFSAHVGAPHCVATNSGTAALHLALLALDLPRDAEVIVPTLTFVATAHAAVLAGANVVFADVDAATLTLDPADLEHRASSRTCAILPVHYGGHPCAMDELHGIARRVGAVVIEDAAHAAGARYRGRPVGGLSPMTCFSFQGVKNMSTGEGGCVTTTSEPYAKRLRRLRWLGIERDTWQRTAGAAHDWRYEVEELGLKYHMHDIAAAIGLVQLDKLEALNERRRTLAERYDDAFRALGWLELPANAPEVLSARHNYAVRLERRDELIAWLAEREIASGVHYVPLHLQPFYRRAGVRLPVAERVWQRLLLLPLYPSLGDDEQQRVIDAVYGFGRARGL
jgi:perosamine synthetase